MIFRALQTKSRPFYQQGRLQHAGARDADGLPVKPAWAINSLFEPVAKANQISDAQFKRLFDLAQLHMPSSASAQSALKHDLDQMLQFTQQIQKLDLTQVEPLIQIWHDSLGQQPRPDKEEQTHEPKGRVLVDNARRTHGDFYIVPGSLPATK
ncbi:hypothetical protein BCR43DRAFT_492448 [Syncephalastrum racemosum]|uniref:Glutamyl-tRNA(Gln) amidotransferase subunit C, mitochondrial n=1 Tax=Syncephalastrum racemosum TaxID=13706 RepID=A0A1X2HDM8_SYNRA|nr:hypothetical protein BCR43DRAFT_492448 [Syncephalastrum racemosum]